jgi:DNA-binding transcriptional ArsR family regulator
LTKSRQSVISTFIERTNDAIHRASIAGGLEQLVGRPEGAVLPRLLHPLGELPLMEMDMAISALGALANKDRLMLFRLLVQAGHDGMAAGLIAEKLDMPNSSLSFHLAQLRKAELITSERRHRSLIYRANYAAMNGLVDYLTENCCSGAECEPAGLSASHPSQAKRKTA